MKFLAILETEDCGDEASTFLFKKIFTSHEAARAAIEESLMETWEMIRDPNGPKTKPPALVQCDDHNSYFVEFKGSGLELSWVIQEVEVAIPSIS